MSREWVRMARDLRFVMVTGLSGAGKSEAIRCFEDLGYFCVDNLPPTLIPKFADIVARTDGRIQRAALVCDVRGGLFFDHLFEALEELVRADIEYQILFLEATEEALVQRFKQTRRRHPLVGEGTSLVDAIQRERARLAELRNRATTIIDTTNMGPRELKEAIMAAFFHGRDSERIHVIVRSFGFKYGLPLDADLVFDVRFLPNPYYVEQLEALTGNDLAVANYVFQSPAAQRFLLKVRDLLEFLLPLYIQEGKTELVIAIGCTGGKHRSVAVTNRLSSILRKKGYRVSVDHRELRALASRAAHG